MKQAKETRLGFRNDGRIDRNLKLEVALRQLANLSIVCFLLLIGAIAICSVIDSAVRRDFARFSNLVNFSGRQRMLSTRIVKDTILIMDLHSSAKTQAFARRQLRESIEDLLRRQKVIEDLTFPRANTAQVRELESVILEARPLIRSIIAGSRSLVDLKSPERDSIEGMTVTEQKLIPVLDRIVLQLEQLASDSEIGHQRSRFIVLTTLGLGLLFLGVGFGVPIIGRLKSLKVEIFDSLFCLAMVAERTSNGVVITDVDRKITWVNEAFTSITGYTLEEVKGKGPGQILQSDLTEPKTIQEIRVKLGNFEHLRCEVLNKHKDGSLYWLELSIDPYYDEQGRHMGFIAIESDVTASVNAREVNKRLEVLHEKTQELANVGGWEIDLEAGSVYWSDQVRKIHEVPDGYVPSIETGIHFYDVEARETISDLVANAINDGAPFDVELPLITYTGRRIWVRALGLPLCHAGLTTRIFGTFQDVTEKRVAADRLALAASTDILTGLLNRSGIQNRIQLEFERYSNCGGNPFGVLFIDMDRFKLVNDTLGHAVGDQLLIEIGSRLNESIRSTDSLGRGEESITAARLGGDEFVILLGGVKSDEDVINICERILTRLSKPYNLSGHEVKSTASIGVALVSKSYSHSSELLGDADTAMYEAKAAGKGRAVLFELAMREKVQSIIETEVALRRAVEMEEFTLHYQPIIDLNIGAIASCEALIRWQHPTKGLLSPFAFIEQAEENGMIVEIGTWVLHEACRQYVEWKHVSPGCMPRSVSINVSRKQLFDKDFAKNVDSAIRNTGISPSSLHVEITEYGVMHDVDQAIRALNKLREIGIKISLDDFGTGFSSLSCLSELPIDILKLDRSFIQKMFVTEGATALVRSIVTLAKDLDIEVVAEGIESKEQLSYLQNLSCEFGQGYLLSRPILANDIPSFCSAGLPIILRSQEIMLGLAS